MIVVGLDGCGAAAAQALRHEYAALSSAMRRPVGIATLPDNTPSAAWPMLETAMADALAGLPLDACRRIGMHWEVVLVTGLETTAAQVKALMHHWASRSHWPLRATLLIDGSTRCRPWDSAGRTAGSWEGIVGALRELDRSVEEIGFKWNGAYFVGSGNRFGCVTEESFACLYLVRLLTVLAASDLTDWLHTLPTFCDAGTWVDQGTDVVRVSAIGVSSFWHPPLPWREQALAVQAHRRAQAYASDRRLGNLVTFNRWLTAHVEHTQQLTALEGRLLGPLSRYLEMKDAERGEQCRELVAKATERQANCIEPLRPTIEQAGVTLFEQLEQGLRRIGQELVLRGGTAAFADMLACLEGRLAVLRDAAARHQAGVQDLLRIDGRLLAELLAEANGSAIGLGQPRPLFFLLRWLQCWRRRRWLARTTQVLFHVLRGEVLQEVDAMLLRFCERATNLLRRHRADLRRFCADLDAVGRQWREEARLSFKPPVPTDVAGMHFAAVERWVEGLFGPVAEPPAEALAEGPHWQEWDRGHLAKALRARAEEDAAPQRGRFDEGIEACGQAADAEQLTALARLSAPLVPVTCWGYDSHPQHVFQRWLVPAEDNGLWPEVELPSGGEPVPCGLPWPTAITVFRDLPLAALANGHLHA